MSTKTSVKACSVVAFVVVLGFLFLQLPANRIQKAKAQDKPIRDDVAKRVDAVETKVEGLKGSLGQLGERVRQLEQVDVTHLLIPDESTVVDPVSFLSGSFPLEEAFRLGQEIERLRTHVRVVGCKGEDCSTKGTVSWVIKVGKKFGEFTDEELDEAKEDKKKAKELGQKHSEALRAFAKAAADVKCAFLAKEGEKCECGGKRKNGMAAGFEEFGPKVETKEMPPKDYRKKGTAPSFYYVIVEYGWEWQGTCKN